MFGCKVCSEKDKRIADLAALLKEQTALVKYVISPTYSHAIEQQANTALNGANIEVMPAPKEMTEVEKQAIAMLTGDYN